MLALFRVERALNFTLPYHISKSVPYFQRCYSCVGMNNNYKMIGESSNKASAERKKHKSIASVWRRMSTQSCSAYDGHGGAELGTELAEPHIGSTTTLTDKEEVSSTDKHSISLEMGSVQSKIEEDLGIKIIFPSSRKEESIIIEGASLDSITRASERVQLIIDEAVKSSALDYSHFVSLPLAIHPQLVDKLVNFQNSILGLHNLNPNEILQSSCSKDTSDVEHGDQKLDEATQVAVTLKTKEDSGNVKVDVTNIPLVSYPPKSSSTSTSKPKTSTLSELGIDKSIFIKPKTFHLTVLMLKLWNKERVDAAVKIFEGIAGEIMDAYLYLLNLRG